MAKDVKIDVIVDDKGTTKKVGLAAKNTGDQLNKLNKSTSTNERVTKGAAKASSNQTKNFSKMAGGISNGLVPAYATLAAQLFAISAAYLFLKRSGDLAVLKEGQVAYASATGIALRSLTHDIIAATDAQVTFADASQAAAIGIASGLNPEQLVKIGEAAKSASIILGRDVTDSFNRLVKGITKAEPELLDELGIILRLEAATTTYGNAIGKNAKELTAFERAQAVSNEVLGQAEDKYGKILAIVDPSVNKFAQLGKAFDDILNSIKLFTAYVAGPLANVLVEFPQLALISVGLLLKKVVVAALPGISTLDEKTTQFARNAKAAMLKAERGSRDYTKSLVAAALANKELTKQKAASRAQDLMGGMTPRAGSGFAMLQAGDYQKITAQQLAGMRAAVTSNSAMFKNMSNKNKAVFIQALNEMRLVTAKTTKNIELQFTKMYATTSTLFQRMKLSAVSAFSAITAAAQKASVLITKALSFAGWAAMVATIGLMIYQFFKAGNTADEQVTKITKLTEKVSSLAEEYKYFNLIQRELNEEGNHTLGFLEAFGQRIGSMSTYQTRDMFEHLIEGMEDYSSEAETLLSTVKELENAQKTFAQAGIFDPLGRPINARAIKSLEDVLKDHSFADFIKREGEDSQKAFISYLEDQVAALEKSTDSYAKNTPVFKDYIDSIKGFLQSGGTEETIQLILRQKDALGELTATLAGLNRQQKDNQDASANIFRAFMPDTEYDRAISSLSVELEDLAEVMSKVTEMGEDELGVRLDRMLVINKEVELFKALNEQEHKNNILKEKAKAFEISGSIGLTPGQSSLFADEIKAVNIEMQRNELLQKRDLILRTIAEKNGQDIELETRSLELSTYQLDTLRAQAEELERQRDLIYQIADGANAAFESSLQGGIASLIKGEETSLKTAILKIAQTTVSSVADTLSKQITDKIMGRSPAQIARVQADIISGSFLNAGERVADMISRAILGTPQTTVTSSSAVSGTAQAFGFGTSRSGGLLNMLRTASTFIPGMPNLPGFADGGVVTKPTAALIGEGRYNEAVVPLPDGKRIPVDIKGATGGSQVNNIHINVSNDGSSSSTSASNASPDSRGLANAIAQAVQKELQNQKRSGGILNPFGAA